jgi:hypothetical protein
MLRVYGIRPEKIREGSATFRGYRRASFEDAWARYLPAIPENPEQSEQAEHSASRAGSDVPANPRVPGSENDLEHDNPHKHGDVPGVPGVPGNPGNGGEGQCHLTNEATTSEDVAGLFADPPEWLRLQAAECVRQGVPERLLKPLAAAVSLHLFSSAERWRKVLPEVRNALEEEAM